MKIGKCLIFIWLSWQIGLISIVHASELRLASSTSAKSSGLLDILIPEFEKQSGYSVKTYAVGTGKALRMGRKGKVDVLLVHAPEAEEIFIRDGYGMLRTPVMKNDFIIAGPGNDPAHVHGLHDVKQAFTRIKDSNSLFLSRADDSGTHKKEMSIWEACEISPYGDWYYELGASMGSSLILANSKQAYIIVDRGTWLKTRSSISLKLHVEGDPLLINPYSIIAVDPKRHNKINFKGAQTFIAWMTGNKGQQIINQLQVDGEHLYTVTVKQKL